MSADRPTLHIQLLGDFYVTLNDQPVAGIDTPRLQSLLAYLMLHRDAPQSRQHLAYLFWPDSTDTQARTNLRQLLYHLRHALPAADRFLNVKTQTLQWQPDAPFVLDVADFASVLDRVDEAEQAGDRGGLQAALEEAVELYRGNLLPNCYDDWLLSERERLSQTFIRTSERLIRLLEGQRDYRAAIRYAQRLLRYDPLHEATYRRLMRLHALNGDRARALRVYHECATTMQRELGVEPSRAIQEAYERLLFYAEAQPAPPSRTPTTLGSAVSLVGRQLEWECLQAAWRTVVGGQSQFALIAGEAGIGKTRLAEELLEWAMRQDITAARTRSYAAEGRLAYAPVTEWLRTDPLQATLLRLDDVWLTEIARLLPELRVERPDLPHPEPLTERWQRRRLFEALARAFSIARQPLLLVIDGLQWCDRETLEWLHYLLRFDPRARMLIVGTVRPGEAGDDHPLTSLLLDLRGTERLTEIILQPLDETETSALAAQVADEALDPSLIKLLYRETEGNPLFVVETVRAGLSHLESPTSGVQALPPRVQAVIESRLAQLSPPAQELAGVAAVIGREFTFDVLAEASQLDRGAVVRSLDELWKRRIVREQSADAYDFTHDKIRDGAYARMSSVRQRLLHRRVAQALEIVYASDLDSISGQLAVHYQNAGLPERAIQYCQRAAGVAQRVYANTETIRLLSSALDLADSLPNSSERAESELALLIPLGTALRATKGYGAPEVGQALTRARELCWQIGETPQLISVLWGLHSFNIVRAELRTARKLGEQSLRLTHGQSDTALAMAAHFMLGGSSFHLGELNSAREHLKRSIALYNPQQHGSYVRRFGALSGVFGRSLYTHALWHLGYPGQALKISEDALAQADDLSHPFSQAIALDYAAMLHQFRREPQAARKHTEAAIALCTEYGFAYYLAWATIIHGWTLADQGRSEQGIAQMEQGLANLNATGARLRRSYYLGLLAEAYGNAGQVEKGLSMLDEALAFVEESDERYHEAELHRLKGRLLVTQGRAHSEAEACFRRSIDVARRQHAESLELRAATSLSRLWQSQGKSDEARELLAEVYGWFNEGFDTPDLQEAGALLEGLS